MSDEREREKCGDGPAMVYLRAFEANDWVHTHKWRSDPEVFKLTMGRPRFVSSERERQWVEEKAHGSDHELYLAICKSDTGEMIGYLSLLCIDWQARSAEWNGPVIGERSLWSRGYGTAAGKLMLEHAFREMGLHRVYGFVRVDNAASIKLLQKLRFRIEGRMRDAAFRDGRFQDAFLVAILDEDFLERRRAQEVCEEGVHAFGEGAASAES